MTRSAGRPAGRGGALGALVLGAVVATAGVAGCGSWTRVGSQERGPEPAQQLTQLLDLPAYYKRIGRLAAGDPLPFVGSIAFAEGAGDTVITVLGLSLENRALNFQKEGNGFAARYHVDIAFERPGTTPVTVSRDETVRVATFQETQRADESILFQQVFKLLPGPYHVRVALRDPATTNASRAERDVTAPAFGPATTSAPILVYQATGRSQPGDPLQVVLNSRGTLAYGGDTLLAYVEGYRFTQPTTVPFEVRTEDDSVVYADSLHFHGGRAVESQVIRLAPDSIALGELKLAVGHDSTRQVSALVSFSAGWVVTNFDQMLDFLRYFGQDAMIARMRKAPPAERAVLWRQFWRATDPDPTTPENEAISAYIARVAIANQRFRDEAVAGWRTDRGEVFITLGEPDESFETSPGQTQRVVRWSYTSLRLTLLFVDETGFGRYRLTPASRAEYERVLTRERARARS
ncbi:MAG TPA: GWxTD domain-containing protein [Gemmatimonadales bacterium]|nr:GWxTD domain-containing protein [Gemmatimonadales bacterium]